jgi:outer membrane protein OmpA-like peptidoglycan-associated protein
MRKILFILLILVGVSTSAQDFKNWSLEAEIGGQAIDDASAKNDGNFVQLGLASRVNLTRTFGFMAKYDFNTLSIISGDDYTKTGLARYGGRKVSGNSHRFSAEVVVDIYDLTELDRFSENWTILGHFGPGMIFVPGESVFTWNGGATLLRKLNNNFALKADYSVTGLMNQDKTWDGIYKANAEGITSVIRSAAIGLVWYPAKKEKRDLVHADWYVPEVVYQQIDTTIVNNHIVNLTEVTNNTVADTVKIQEFVFFDHDKDVIRLDESDNAITKIYTALVEDPDATVLLTGWASATSSTDAYNQELSARRCQSISDRLVAMGIAFTRVNIDPSGKDFHLDDVSLHDLARRVEMLIVK